MRIALPYLVKGSFKRTARKSPEPGMIIHTVECDIEMVEPQDAPVVVRFIGQGDALTEVRFHDGHYFVPAHYDDYASWLAPVTIDTIENFASDSKESYVSMIRELVQDMHGPYGFVAYFNMFKRLHDPLAGTLPNQLEIVTLTEIVSTEGLDKAADELKIAAKKAYEHNIVIENTFWRRCDEPRYVASIGATKGNVAVDPPNFGTATDLKRATRFDGLQATLTFRLDRFEDFEAAMRERLSEKAKPLLKISKVELIDPATISFDDEAYQLKSAAFSAVEDGWAGLKSETTAAATAWVDMRERLSSVMNVDNHYLEELAAKMQRFCHETNNTEVKELLEASLKRWEMRPLLGSTLRM